MNGGIILNHQPENGKFYEAIEENISEFLFTNREDLFVPLINVLEFQLKEDRKKHAQLKQSIDELIGKEEKPNGDEGDEEEDDDNDDSDSVDTSASAGQIKKKNRIILNKRNSSNEDTVTNNLLTLNKIMV